MRKTLASLGKALVFVAVCAALALALAAGIVFFRSHDADESSAGDTAPLKASTPQSAQSAQSSGPAQTSSPSVNTSPIDVTIPTDAVDQALTRTSEVLAAPENTFEPGDALASTALEDLQATAEEWGLLGYRQEGKAVLSDVQVLTLSDTGEKMEVIACVDSSDVRIMDENGKEVADDQAPARSRSIFELQFLDGKWKVTNQSFPEDPEC